MQDYNNYNTITSGQILSTIKNENKELNILSAIYLLGKDVCIKVMETGLEPKHFYSPIFGKLYAKAVDISLEDNTPTYQDIPDDLLNSYNFSETDLMTYLQDCKDVISLSKRRLLASNLLKGLTMIEQDKSEAEVLNVLEGSMSEHNDNLETLQDITFESIYNNKVGEVGVITGFPTFDNSGVKFLNGQLIAIGADTGAGKTTFMLNVMAHQIKMGNKVLMYSLEQPVREIMMKLLTILSGYSEKHIATGNANEEVIKHWYNVIQKNVFVVYKDGITISEIKARTKMLHSTHNFNLICVDYWQLINGAGSNALEKYVSTADGLLGMALTLNLPVIALAQVDKNSSRMQDLDRNAFSGSKQLSNNASYILMLQRDKETNEVNAEIVKSRKPNHYGKRVYLDINRYSEKLSERIVK